VGELISKMGKRKRKWKRKKENACERDECVVE
jgi:hypothetical protein